jgi:hypothetical protein
MLKRIRVSHVSYLEQSRYSPFIGDHAIRAWRATHKARTGYTTMEYAVQAQWLPHSNLKARLQAG